MPTLTISPHPLLDARAFTASFLRPIGELASPDWLCRLLALDAEAPLRSDDVVRAAVRDLLRHGGFKPTGRSKPASEYLIRAASEGQLASINAAVDACNAVSLHSGLPISVVDLDKLGEPLSVAVAGQGQSYVFNSSGQAIDLAGLVCLFDKDGPCANAVKDAQRTKTSEGTRRTLSIIWGAKALGDRPDRTEAWYREIVGRLGAKAEAVTPPSGAGGFR
jgi:DNA/RNA-binding domain of Phe-tRNA-synthetase-like protein